MVILVQEFQIGQRVRPLVTTRKPFVIQSIYCETHGSMRYCPDIGYIGFLANELALAPERPPYVPSERSVFVKEFGQEEEKIVDNIAFRCETDAELAERHAIERAKYDAQGGAA